MDTVSTWTLIYDYGTGTSQYMFLTPRASVGESGVVIIRKKNSTEMI